MHTAERTEINLLPASSQEMNRDYEKVRSPEFLRKIPVATYIMQEKYIIHKNMLISFLLKFIWNCIFVNYVIYIAHE